MDENGYILTADSTLALIVVVVFTATVASYSMLPMYMGQDHQHLEALGDSVLQTMEQDGTLKYASVQAANGSTADARDTLQERIHASIPPGIGYEAIMNVGGNVVTADSSREPESPSFGKDIATRVRVISGPEEGWWGRAWFKSEPVEFINKEIRLTTTVWNFHNWLTNFSPWNSGNGLRSYTYWGRGSSAQTIPFAIPAGARIFGARYLVGSSSTSSGLSYGTNTFVNSRPALVANSNEFVFLNVRPTTSTRMYNYLGTIPVSYLQTPNNNFYVRFIPRPSTSNTYDMAWFAILADYSTNITIPENVTEETYSFPNAAGLAVYNEVELGSGRGYGRIFDLDSGTLTNLNSRRAISWNNMRNRNHGFDNGIPFVITSLPGVTGTGHGTGVSVVRDIPIPSNTNLLDAYVVVNSWGANDGALVEVWDSQSNNWRTVFNSFNVDGITYSDRSDGYGNLPGIIYLGDQLRTGANNKVRVTVFDDVPSSDYDLCGVEDSYVKVFTSPYKVRWSTYPFRSHQSRNNVEEQTRSFGLTTDSQKAMMFMGVGLNTRQVTVRYDGTSQILYQGPVPFSLDLAQLDAQKRFFRITTPDSTPGNYTLRPGSYSIRVRVDGPSNAWESGDYDANAAIFSGTRIAVINPQIQNEWSAGMGRNPQDAMANATAILLQKYPGINPDDVHTSALFAGNTPNAVTIRLKLWKQ